jgi:hypothetical protein
MAKLVEKLSIAIPKAKKTQNNLKKFNFAY